MGIAPNASGVTRPVAIGYVRVSVDTSGDARSLDAQTREVERTAAEHGWYLEHVYDDTESASAYALERGVVRTGWADLLARVERRGVAAVILAEVARAAREATAAQTLARLCARTGTVIVAKGRTFSPDDASDAFMFSLEVLFAVQESDRISTRVKRGVRGSIAEGRPPAGRVPFGYLRPAREPGARVVQVPHPEHADAVRDAADRLLKGRTTLSKLATEWSRMTGKRWNPSAVRKALTNPSLIGRRVVRGGTVAGNWEPILPVDTYYALQGFLTAPDRKVTRGPESTTLLASIATCAHCGSVLRTKEAGRTYVCGGGYCTARSREWVDSHVVEATMAAMYGSALLHVVGEVKGSEGPDESSDVAAAREELVSAERELSEFQATAAASGLPPAIVVSTLVGYQERVDRARERMGDLGASRGRAAEPAIAEVRAVVEALCDEYGDVAQPLAEMRLGEALWNELSQMWAAADLVTRRRWVHKALRVSLRRPDSRRRVDTYATDTLILEPRGGLRTMLHARMPEWWTPPGE